MVGTSVGAGAGLTVGRRGASRARVGLNAPHETSSRSYRVLLRSLSETGAMVEGCDLPRRGRTVWLKRGEIDALATVVWATATRCGLHFDERLSRAEVVEAAAAGPERLAASSRIYPSAGDPSDRISAEDWSRSLRLFRG